MIIRVSMMRNAIHYVMGAKDVIVRILIIHTEPQVGQGMIQTIHTRQMAALVEMGVHQTDSVTIRIPEMVVPAEMAQMAGTEDEAVMVVKRLMDQSCPGETGAQVVMVVLEGMGEMED